MLHVLGLGLGLGLTLTLTLTRHGVLHVSSFVTCASAGHAALAARGARRAVYKLAAGVGLGLGLGLGSGLGLGIGLG